MASLTGTAAGTGAPGVAKAGTQRYYQRFDRIDRLMHAALMITFIGCAITGLPPLFSDHAWAAALARLFGGFESAGLIHRLCAAVMIVVFVSHVLRVFFSAVGKVGLLPTLWGPKSMTPQPQDIIDMYRHVMWFIGKGPRPQFDRYTYWEKFDYWAVFWGMFIIGGSGLMLWFPHAFTTFLPGWIFNIATVIHGEEALLAVGFIFTIHFFNGHIRPEKFPMDLVIFTGRIPEHEMKEERTLEYQRLEREGRLEAARAPAPSRRVVLFGYIVGGTAVTLGTVVIVLIFYSVIR
jgi:cytochrome b subunit of formate dehydrogenase